MVFGKKKQEDILEEEQKGILFSSKKSTRPSFTNANPYAAQGPDPYAAAPSDPYAPVSTSSAPPPYGGSDQGGFDRYRQEKSPVPPGGYGGGLPSGPRAGPGRVGSSASDQGSSRYGSTSGTGYKGYGGEDRYGAPTSRYGTGGYGGLGAQPSSQNDDTNRETLFGNAASRSGGSQSNAYASNNYGSGAGNDYANNRYGSSANQTAVDEWNSGKGPSYGQDSSQGYGGNYEQRELTAEEQEEEEVSAVKQEIRAIKQQDVSSTRNALRIAQQAEETGRATLERLGAQGERIHNTERNLDLSSIQNRIAAEKARELKTLNRSMFAVHVANPFTSKQRTAEHEAQVLDQARLDREQRDATRSAAWSTNARAQKTAMGLNKATGGPKKTSLAERSKYQFEADSEDEQMEDEIDQNLDLLHGAAGRLKQLSLAMGEEVDAQNKHIERIGGKVDKVDDEIALNRSRLDRIR